MAIRKMTLTEALAELKLLDKKIDKKLRELYNTEENPVIDYKVGKNKNLVLSNTDEETFKRKAQGILDSLKALINNRKKLKGKIAETNAKTKVNVAGKEYTIVEAIERKNNLPMEEELLRKLVNQYSVVQNRVQSINERAEEEVNRLLEAKLSNESKNTPAEEIKKLKEILLSDMSAEIYDPLNLKEYIENLDNEIEEFRRNVDVALSIINAKTEIEIDFDEE